MFERHPEIQIDDCKNGVIKPGIEKHSESNEVPYVGSGDFQFVLLHEEAEKNLFLIAGTDSKMNIPKMRHSQGERPRPRGINPAKAATLATIRA